MNGIVLNFAKSYILSRLSKLYKKKNFTMPFMKYKRLKLKLRVFLVGHSVAMVTHCVMKIIPTCSPVIGQFFDTMIVPYIHTHTHARMHTRYQFHIKYALPSSRV